MAKQEKKTLISKKFKLYHLPILPYFLIVDTFENIKERRYTNALMMFVITIVFLGVWLGGYALTAVLGYQIVKQGIVGKQTAFNLNPTPSNFIDDYKLLGMVNDYRSSEKISTISLDDETCKIAQSILATDFWNNNLEVKNYNNVCPKCNTLSVAESQSEYNLDSIINFWKGKDVTLKALRSKNTYGCVKVDKDKVVLVMASKSVIAPATTTNNTVSDPLVNCNINVNCGGGTKSMKSSECNQSTCCQIGSKWYFYFSKTKCTADQAANTQSTSTNYNYTYTPPTYYPCTLYYPALNLYQTYNSLYKTKADCDAAQASIGQGTQPIQYMAPAQQVPQITKSQCQASVNDKWRSQMMSQGCAYPCPDTGDCGSTGTCSFMWQQVQKEMNNCNQYP